MVKDEKPRVSDHRAIPGGSATLSNVGHAGARIDDEDVDLDVVAGTSSGVNLRGKPKSGHFDRGRY